MPKRGQAARHRQALTDGEDPPRRWHGFGDTARMQLGVVGGGAQRGVDRHGAQRERPSTSCSLSASTRVRRDETIGFPHRRRRSVQQAALGHAEISDD